MLDVRVHVGALFRPITAIRALKSRTFAALVLKVPPQSIPLLVDLAAVLTNMTLLRKLLLLLSLLLLLLLKMLLLLR